MMATDDDESKKRGNSHQANTTRAGSSLPVNRQKRNDGVDDAIGSEEDADIKGTTHWNNRQQKQQLVSSLLSSSTTSTSIPAISPNKYGKSLLRTITVSPNEIKASISSISIVDPWVARIRNNDEYLQFGIDFSKGKKVEGRQKKQQHAQQQERERQTQQPHLTAVVGDLGAQRLAQALLYNTHLLHLNLSNNDIGNDGAIALANCLFAPTPTTAMPNTDTCYESKTALQSLNLSHNHVSSKQASVALAQALTYNTSLRELNLDHNQLPIEGILLLLDGLAKNATLIRLGMAYSNSYHSHNMEKNEANDIIDDAVNNDICIIEPINIHDKDCTSSTHTNDVVKGHIDRIDGSEGAMHVTFTSLLVQKVQIVLHKCARGESALEVLEMHGSRDDAIGNHSRDKLNNTIDHESSDNDNFEQLSKNEVWGLLRSIRGANEINNCNGDAPVTTNDIRAFKNHRFRQLTLPSCSNSDGRSVHGQVVVDGGHNNIFVVQQLRRAFRFNRFYYPILELNDILQTLQAEDAEQWRRWSVQMKLPIHLRIDEQSGALTGLLPLKLSSAAASSLNGGIEYKLMPMVLSYACRECQFLTVWNIIRFRPDIFSYFGEVVPGTRRTADYSNSSRLNNGKRIGKRCCIS